MSPEQIAGRITAARRERPKITDPAILAKVAALVVGEPAAKRRAS